jgi:DNA polymerase III subunit delta
MNVKTGEADSFVAKPPAKLVAALVYGPDSGMVRERAARLAKSAVPDLSDPFRVAEIDDGGLESDPARLWDEAAALSMTGGRRVVRVRGAGNGAAKDFERFLDQPPGDALVVVEAGDLARNSALRKVFESADNAAAIACYPDSERTLEDLIRAEMKAHGLSITPEALGYAVSRLGSDRGVTRSELEKLALYATGEKTVTEAHIDAVMGDESELRVEAVLDAAGTGDYVVLDRELSRLWASGTSPIGALRQAMTHFQRLLSACAEKDGGADVGTILKRQRPPVHFSRESAFRQQLGIWSVEKLDEALTHLYEAEALAKTTAVPAEAVTGRALLSVAALAKVNR